MDAALHKRFTNLFELNRNPTMFGRSWNAFTNLFKTYATLSPGFFVRNFIGGTFMNTADGVHAASARPKGRRCSRSGCAAGMTGSMLSPSVSRTPSSPTFASGAGGRFEDAGVLAQTNSRWYNMASIEQGHPLRSAAQGTRVEGAMRLGMALDSIDRGDDVEPGAATHHPRPLRLQPGVATWTTR